MPALHSRQSVEDQEAHLGQNKTHDLGGFSIVLIIIATACMLLRVLSRSITRQYLARDDWTFLGGSSIAVGLFIVSAIYAFDAGLGEHWVALTPDQKVLFPKLNYAYNILNLSCYPIIKLSILLLYIRIFVTSQFRLWCWGGIVFLSCMCIANTLVAIFACRPVRGFYDLSVPAKCINDVRFYWATAILNIVTDMYILVLPMPIVWRLHTTLKRRLAISTIFMLGGLTFIVSIIRIVYYLDFSAQDPSWSFLKEAYATPAEVCLAVVVASAPTWRPVWTYTRHMASAILSSHSRSHSSARVILSAAHSKAMSIAKADESRPQEDEEPLEEVEISRKSSATRMEGEARFEAKEERPSAEASSHSETALTVVSQAV